MTNIYDFKAMLSNGKEVELSEFKGKTMIIVNTASKCGFTPQFDGLQSLYEKYNEEGLVVLGFPSDQFNNQEFDNDEETLKFCQLNYGVSFPMFKKIHVNGENAHPLFKFLVNEKKGLLTDAIKWNFTKFLIDPNGKVIKRYAPQITPEKIEADLQQFIKQKSE